MCSINLSKICLEDAFFFTNPLLKDYNVIQHSIPTILLYHLNSDLEVAIANFVSLCSRIFPVVIMNSSDRDFVNFTFVSKIPIETFLNVINGYISTTLSKGGM